MHRRSRPRWFVSGWCRDEVLGARGNMLNPRAGAEPASIGLTVECSNAEQRIVNVLGAISASIRSISGHWATVP